MSDLFTKHLFLGFFTLKGMRSAREERLKKRARKKAEAHSSRYIRKEKQSLNGEIPQEERWYKYPDPYVNFDTQGNRRSVIRPLIRDDQRKKNETPSRFEKTKHRK